MYLLGYNGGSVLNVYGFSCFRLSLQNLVILVDRKVKTLLVRNFRRTNVKFRLSPREVKSLNLLF